MSYGQFVTTAYLLNKFTLGLREIIFKAATLTCQVGDEVKCASFVDIISAVVS